MHQRDGREEGDGKGRMLANAGLMDGEAVAGPVYGRVAGGWGESDGVEIHNARKHGEDDSQINGDAAAKGLGILVNFAIAGLINKTNAQGQAADKKGGAQRDGKADDGEREDREVHESEKNRLRAGAIEGLVARPVQPMEFQ